MTAPLSQCSFGRKKEEGGGARGENLSLSQALVACAGYIEQ